MFENKKFEGIHYSRFIASWVNVAGQTYCGFEEWLETLTINDKKIPEPIIHEIYEMAITGKLELENSAREFYNEFKKQFE